MRRLHLAFFAASIPLALPCLLPAQGGFSGPGTYEILNLKSGRVIDLDRNDQSTVIQFSSRGTDNQAWVIGRADSGYFFIRNGMNGHALESAGRHNSSPLRGAPFNGSPAQQWRIEPGKDGNAILVNRMSDKAIDVPDGAARDGIRLQVYDTNGDSNQRFMLRPVRGNFGRGWSEGPGRREERPGPALPAPGRRGGNESRVVCASDDGRRRHCPMDTNGEIRMVRQIGGPPCTEGRTWGVDGRGVWVDRGCRAEFEVGPRRGAGPGPGGPGGPRRDGPPVIVCASEGGRRSFCEANTRDGVRLLRQTGGRCIEGETWGYSNRGIWVDRGCRAEFALGR